MPMDFVIILFAHWVGDFLLQTSSMALNKSKTLKWLGLHVLTYTAVLLVLSSLIFSWQVALGFAVINGLLHLVTDFFTSKLSARHIDKPRIYFPIIGFDQFIHLSCLYWTYLNSDILAI